MKKIDNDTARYWWERISFVIIMITMVTVLGFKSVLVVWAIVAYIMLTFYVVFKAPTWIEKAWNYFATEDPDK